MGRKKNQSKAISDVIKPEMSPEDKWMAATLGDLSGYSSLLVSLNEFYHSEPGTHTRLMASLDISTLLVSELEAGNCNFFEALAKMIPIARDHFSGASPIERALLFFQGVREETFAIDGYEINALVILEKLKQLFPVWPATIKELHAVISGPIKCDEKTIRDAVKRLGYPVRAGKMGAPKREK